MASVIHVDFRAHSAARRVSNPDRRADSQLAHATQRLWLAEQQAIKAHRERRRDRPAIQTLWDNLDYPLSERLMWAAWRTLAGLREERHGGDPHRGAL